MEGAWPERSAQLFGGGRQSSGASQVEAHLGGRVQEREISLTCLIALSGLDLQRQWTVQLFSFGY